MKARTLAASAAVLLATTAWVAAQPGHHPGPPPPPGGPGHGPPPHEASVTAFDAHTIGLARPEGWTKSVGYDDATHFHRGPEPSSASDLRVGMRVHEHDRPGTLIAEDVDMLPDGPGCPGRSGSKSWVLLPAGLAMGGWYAFYGRRKQRRCPGPDLMYPARD